MQLKRFNDSAIKSLKPSAKEQLYTEEGSGGFGVRVFPSGVKSFFYRYKFDGVRDTLALGQYKQSNTTTGITLAEARKGYVEAKNKVQIGINPNTEKKKVQVERTRTPFIADLVTEYIMFIRDKKKLRSWKEVERALLRDFVPIFGKLKITELTRRDVRALLDNVADTGANVMANRIQAYISGLLSYAVDREAIPVNYLLRMQKAGGTEEAKTRNLALEEVKTFWLELDKAKAAPVYKIALKLILLTGQRPSEVCGMRRDEIDGEWWTIPASRMKSVNRH